MLPSHVDSVAATFRMLGDPTRIRILDSLGSRELCVGDLAKAVGISEPPISHQLRLRRARTKRIVRSSLSVVRYRGFTDSYSFGEVTNAELSGSQAVENTDPSRVSQHPECGGN